MSGSTTIGNVTYVPFNFSPYTPFQFQCTLDAELYTVIVTWNLFSQRWYFTLYDSGQNVILLMPVISSAPGANQNLVAGYFTDTLVYRNSSNQFEITNLSGA